jgi:hypothetical protein
MRRVAERYARKEKAIKSGYQIADEAYYESTTIAQLLPFVIASVIDGTVLNKHKRCSMMDNLVAHHLQQKAVTYLLLCSTLKRIT